MSAQTYRALPVAVESIQWTGDFTAIPTTWRATDMLYLDSLNRLVVRTPNGPVKPPVGHHIVHGTAGEFYPISPAVHRYKYQLAEDFDREQAEHDRQVAERAVADFIATHATSVEAL